MDADLPFVIESEKVERLRKATGLDMEAFLAALVEPTRALAWPPISKFHVGAVGLGSSGRVFRGVNVEFPGLPLNCSIHAEQFLVANAAHCGERQLRFLAVSAAPCGHCRQFLQELRGAVDIRVLIVDGKKAEEALPLSFFLPHRFGPQDLLDDDFPLLLEPQLNNLQLPPLDEAVSKAASPPDISVASFAFAKIRPSPSDDELATGPRKCIAVDQAHAAKGLMKGGDVSSDLGFAKTLSPAGNDRRRESNEASSPAWEEVRAPEQALSVSFEPEQLTDLRNAALEAANSSYAPYTKNPSGIAFLTKNGEIFQGPYFESAAYNPSLPPLQSAIVAFVVQGGYDFTEISHVVLVEKEDACVWQAASVRLCLEQISPGTSFHAFKAHSL